MVKGNAYGHGLPEVVSILDESADYFQIDDLDELRELRKISAKPVLLLGYVAKAAIEEALALGCELAIYDVERLPVLQKAADSGKPVRIHLKIDALLGRQGLLPTELDDFLAELRHYPGIELVAAYAHFANIEDTTDLGHALAQAQLFEFCHRKIADAGWPNLGRHLSATSGLMTIEGSGVPNDIVRLGVGLYGLYPSAALARTHADLGLRPAMRWVSHLAQVKILPVGHPVGYGLTFIAPREIRIGIVPQGYADGFDRGLSNVGEVLVRGRRCSVLGRVAMNMFAADLSALPDAQAEDEVVLLGRQGGQEITAEEIAFRIGTINYEVTTRTSPLLPRSVSE